MKSKRINQTKVKRKLHKKLWALVSLYIRRRDCGKCYTCPALKPIAEMHCGHYHDASVSNPELNFHEKNLHCQCAGCNLFKSGNKTIYAYNLTKQYGIGILDELMEIKNRVVKWTIEDYETRIAHYQRELNDSRPSN